jgi:hypothetical protein
MIDEALTRINHALDITTISKSIYGLTGWPRALKHTA